MEHFKGALFLSMFGYASISLLSRLEISLTREREIEKAV